MADEEEKRKAEKLAAAKKRVGDKKRLLFPLIFKFQFVSTLLLNPLMDSIVLMKN